MAETTETDLTAKQMVLSLFQAGMTASEISEALAHRVSRRTIYRWAKGESTPQQTSDHAELHKIYAKKSA